MRYFIFFMLLLLSVGCSQKQEVVDISPEQLLLDLNSSQRIATPEQVADWIVNEDPSLKLIDVRNHEAFDDYTLPGAINIPLAHLLQEENESLMDCSRYMLVFFSNDDLLATQAWVLKRFKGCKGALVMQGGLNQWTSTILSPPEPLTTASEEEWELYRFRKAISQYLIGGSEQLEPEEYVVIKKQAASPKKKIEVKPKPRPKVVEEEEEGC